MVDNRLPPLDPLFWFGRLWERAKELANTKDWPLELHSNKNMSTVWIDYKQPIGGGKTEIEALCAAIEALESTGEPPAFQPLAEKTIQQIAKTEDTARYNVLGARGAALRKELLRRLNKEEK